MGQEWEAYLHVRYVILRRLHPSVLPKPPSNLCSLVSIRACREESLFSKRTEPDGYRRANVEHLRRNDECIVDTECAEQHTSREYPQRNDGRGENAASSENGDDLGGTRLAVQRMVDNVLHCPFHRSNGRDGRRRRA